MNIPAVDLFVGKVEVEVYRRMCVKIGKNGYLHIQFLHSILWLASCLFLFLKLGIEIGNRSCDERGEGGVGIDVVVVLVSLRSGLGLRLRRMGLNNSDPCFSYP